MTEPPLLDGAVFDELVSQIGGAALREVVELFVAETGGYVVAIKAGAAQGDDAGARDRARRAAHSLKSSAGQIGAAALAAAALRVEAAATETGVNLIAEAAALSRCAAETEAALTARLPRL
jgi:HPt (histidine-containing phosphotransfer) domain-containing protein